jgi:hypothetical protein
MPKPMSVMKDKEKVWEKIFFDSVRNKLEQIAEHPLLFGERSRKGYREAKVKTFPYLIIYKVYVRKQVIFINSIHHTSKHSVKKYRK